MDLTIYTYGHIDAMFYILNGVAMLNKSALGQTVIALMVMASTVYYATRISYDGTVRYPCQEFENWEKPECNPPQCEATGTCTKDLLPPEVFTDGETTTNP